MDTRTTISTTEARKRLFDIVKEVASPATVYTLTERGRPKAVIMSAEEYESWAETMEVLRDFPDIDKEIKEVNRALKTGAWKKWPTLEDIEKGFVLKERSKKYGVRGHTKNQRKKRAR